MKKMCVVIKGFTVYLFFLVGDGAGGGPECGARRLPDERPQNHCPHPLHRPDK